MFIDPGNFPVGPSQFAWEALWRFAVRIKSAVRRNYSLDTLLRIDRFALDAEII